MSAALSLDGTRIITDFGEYRLSPGESADDLQAIARKQYEAFERMHFRMGGWLPLTEDEFERRLATDTLTAFAMKPIKTIQDEPRGQ